MTEEKLTSTERPKNAKDGAFDTVNIPFPDFTTQMTEEELYNWLLEQSNGFKNSCAETALRNALPAQAKLRLIEQRAAQYGFVLVDGLYVMPTMFTHLPSIFSKVIKKYGRKPIVTE